MRRLLLIAGMALALAIPVSASSAIYVFNATNCGYYPGGVCTAWEGSTQLNFGSNVYNGNGWSFDLTPHNGATIPFWLQKPTTPAGCVLLSAIHYFVNNGQAQFFGTFNPTSKSCGDRPAKLLPTKATMSQVGDGGQVLPPCGPAWWGTTTTLAGHRYFCPKGGHWWVNA